MGLLRRFYVFDTPCITVNYLSSEMLNLKFCEIFPFVKIERKIDITMSDFQKSFNTIVPSTYRGVDGIVESVAVKWEDVAGYNDVKQSLRQVYNHSLVM